MIKVIKDVINLHLPQSQYSFYAITVIDAQLIWIRLEYRVKICAYNSVLDKMQHCSETKEWYFSLMNDPNHFENWRYIDNIDAYNSIIEEFQKLYDKTPAADRFARARILSGMKRSKKTWQKFRATSQEQ
jgi:hypothetical protein